MFRIFRVFLIFFTLACMVLSIFALTGSYNNTSYLTDTYLINVHMYNLNLSALIDTAILAEVKPSTDKLSKPAYAKRATPTKRDFPDAVTSAWGAVTSKADQVWNAATSDAADVFDSSVQNAVGEVVRDFNYQELGFADVYSFGFWGYCKGYINRASLTDTGSMLKFNNKNVNYTWCSPAQAAYRFDPLAIFKTELNGTINNKIDGYMPFVYPMITQAARSDLSVLLENITYESLNLPGSLKKNLDKLGDISTACFALTVALICLCFISIIIQVLGFFLSPDSCCLSFLNFLFELVIALLAVVTAGLITGTYLYIRKQVNNNTSTFGLRSFLSINFYAFIWSAAVAAIVVVFFNLLGHCCGLFGTGRKRYRSVGGASEEHEEHEVAYSHKEYESSDEE
ncbi:actin cortical patch SUR7/pH-response regulator pali [Scheffersomyces xylosifermentans]|uniref:actin cortical patch SUR7/pH-response regulator pali n=1 Tax=Scheffersomyces xylosifermentans TaxID=1304137 RepID=UPI00315C7AD8